MKYLIILFSLLVAFSSTAQNKSDNNPIEFKIDAPDTVVYMARYLGKKMYYADTADLVNGKFVFDGSKHQGGLYAIILPNGIPFDFIIDNEAISMDIKDISNPIGTMDVTKSVNNIAFFDYMRFMTKQRNRGKTLGDTIRNTKSDTLLSVKKKEKRNKQFKDELKEINQEVRDYQNSVIKKHPSNFIGVMIKMSMDVELPDSPRDKNGVITDSNYVYHYYISHYWDNVDLKDARIVNTPVFHNKLDKFFSKKGVLQIPDTISFHATRLIDKTDKLDQTNKVFQYVVHHITNKYETSPIMGLDRVFCYMARNYYCAPNNLAYWMTEENTVKVCERAEKVCRTSPGSPAPLLILPDSTEKNWVNLYRIDAEYTVLYFWDPNCGHCKKVTPKLQTLYDKKFKERNIEIYAVGKATGDDFEDWKKFIREKELEFINVGLTQSVYIEAKKDPTNLLRNYTTLQSLNYSDTYDIYSTPRIYILDKDKKIIFKQISIGQLEEILDKLTDHEEDEKLFPVEDPENGIEDTEEGSH